MKHVRLALGQSGVGGRFPRRRRRRRRHRRRHRRRRCRRRLRRCRHILGIPFRWVTEITHVVQGRYFVDEQRFGPYTFWHHKHFIEPIEGGVKMIDEVDYKLPLGVLGRFAHWLFVSKKVKEIFEYRFKKLNELFGSHSLTT